MKFNNANNSFSNPASGAALQIRVNVGAAANRLRKIDKDGLLFIDLEKQANSKTDHNHALCCFLSEVLGVPLERIEVAAGHDRDDKLVCLLDIPVETVNQRIAFYAGK